VPGNTLLSIRLPDPTRDALDEAARAAGESRSSLMQRFIEEGLLMDRFPGLVFRGGPLGRRAGLVGGPDVWEVIRVVKNSEERGDSAVRAAAEWLALPMEQVLVAIDYYAECSYVVDDWLVRVDATAAAEERRSRLREAVLR
jgi:hypothetical protein